MKKLILTTVLALVSLSAFAQTVDYTGVSISTERVKKTYPTRMSVLVTGVGEYNSYYHVFTGELGARFVWVQRFGFYAGVEFGAEGIPVGNKGSFHYDFGNDYYVNGSSVYETATNNHVGYLSPERNRNTRLTFSVGGVFRVGKHVDIYLGSGLALGRRYVQYSSDVAQIKDYLERTKKYYDDYRERRMICPTAEVGGHFYIGHVTLLAGFSFVPAKYNNCYRLHLGVGYNF